MIRIASIALTSVLGVAGIACAVPAMAGPAVVVEVPAPGFYGAPYAPAFEGYWHRDFGRYGYHHGWDHYRYHHWYRR